MNSKQKYVNLVKKPLFSGFLTRRIKLLLLAILLLACYLFLLRSDPPLLPFKPPSPLSGPVKYDSRSLIINGKRTMIIAGAIHYPRSPVSHCM